MANNIEARRLFMEPAEWERLQELAVETFSRTPGGTRQGQYCWRAMLRRIASGELRIVEAEPYKPDYVAKLDAAIAAMQEQPEPYKAPERPAPPLPAPTPLRPSVSAPLSEPKERRVYRQLSILEAEPA